MDFYWLLVSRPMLELRAVEFLRMLLVFMELKMLICADPQRGDRINVRSLMIYSVSVALLLRFVHRVHNSQTPHI